MSKLLPQSGISARGTHKKTPERIAAADAIRVGIRRWSRDLYIEGYQLPIIRSGRIFAHFGSEESDPVEEVLRGSALPSKKDIADERARLEELVRSIAQCTSAFSAFEKTEIRTLTRAGRRGRTTEERISYALGVEKAFPASATLLLEVAEHRLEQLNDADRKKLRRPGRQKNDAAYTVAAALARLYAKITGRHPTYSEGKDGLSGEYTPVLRSVFDALGWKSTAVRGPASAAVKAIEDIDIHPEELPRGRGISPASSGCVSEDMRSAFQRIHQEAQEKPDDPPHSS